MSGLLFDDLQAGYVFRHEIRRTLTEADNVWFSAVTHNPAYLHLDEEYCRTHCRRTGLQRKRATT